MNRQTFVTQPRHNDSCVMLHISQSFEDANMNKDIIEGKWEQLKGQAKAKWGDLTDDELTEAKGNAQYLAGKVQERYGKTKEEAEAEVNSWFQDNDK